MARFLVDAALAPPTGGCAKSENRANIGGEIGGDTHISARERDVLQHVWTREQRRRAVLRESRAGNSRAGGGYSSSRMREPRHHVPNHLVWAILATIFCCVPTGIVAIVYAAQVNGRLDAGDYEGARSASDSAKTWAIVSMALWLVGGAIAAYIFA